MTLRVRAAVPGDLKTLRRIGARTFDACYRPLLGDERVDWYLDSGALDRELETSLDRCDVLCEGQGAGERIAGFCLLDAELIQLLLVDAAQQRKGYGSALLADQERKLFTAHGTIRLETFEENEPAIRFYLRNGWRIARRAQDPEFPFTRLFFEKNRPVGF